MIVVNHGTDAEVAVLADTRIEQLRAAPLLSSCSREELETLAAHAGMAAIPPGRAIITQGQPGDAMYVVLGGEADVVIDGEVRRCVGVGDVVGEISVLGPGEATATVVSRSHLSVLVLTHDDFAAAVAARGSIALRVISVLVGRLREDEERLAAYNRTLLDYIEQVRQLTAAAAAVEAAEFRPDMLDEVARRQDELGRLARVFGRMATEVEARERRLLAAFNGE